MDAQVSNVVELSLCNGLLETTQPPQEVPSRSAAYVKSNKCINILAREIGSIMATLCAAGSL